MIYQHYFFYIDPGEYKKMNNYQEDQECRSRLPKTQFFSKIKLNLEKHIISYYSDNVILQNINCQRITSDIVIQLATMASYDINI